MTPCTPSSNNLNPPVFPPVPVPGFGIPTSPIQTPLPSFNLPASLLEDFTDLVGQLGALFPSGLFKPNPDFGMKNVLDFISNLFTQLAPFLSFYNFIMSALNMINCVIEILCAIPNPFAIAEKLKKLFTQCLPPFLSLFPPFALPAMIISLLLLILALILYMIETITGIISNIISNLTLLANATTLNDANAVLAAANKIASLLCTIQNVLAIFVAIGAIMAVIKSLAAIAGSVLCSEDDQDGCCPPDLCPEFVKTTPNGIVVTTGKMVYYKQVGADVASILSLAPEVAAMFNIAPIRRETWQVTEIGSNATFPVSLIITPVNDNIFWPDPLEFDSELSLKKACYTVDVTIEVDPNQFGIVDNQGLRTFIIKDCVVVRKPYLGLKNFDNSTDDTFTQGTLNIEGGLVYESDGTTPFIVGVEHATINTFIHEDDSSSSFLPISDDSISFDISFTWKPNAPGLAGYNLTTVGCIPEVNIEKAVQNAVIVAEGLSAVVDKLPVTPSGTLVPSSGDFLPNISGTQACLNSALEAFRQDVSIENAAVFQASIEACLGDLQTQTLATLCAALNSSISQFKSSFDVEPDLQFVTRPIKITAILRDANGTNVGTGIPSTCAEDLASKLTASATFGTVSGFAYDGSSAFIADLSSNLAGTGILTLSFDGKTFNKITTINGASSIAEQAAAYEFIDGTTDLVNRRDNTDVVVS